MRYLTEVRSAHDDPKQLEDLFQSAQQEEEVTEFTTDLLTCYEESPDNLLYKAWYYRLQHEFRDSHHKESKSANWKMAVPLGVLTGLIFWLMSNESLEFLDHIPYLILFWSPIAAFFIMGFLVLTAKEHYRRYFLISAGLVIASVYVFLLAPGQEVQYYRHYLELMALHLPLLAWIGTGILVLGFGSTPESRFAFLIKSLEVFVTGGVYLIVGGMFAGITIGMFDALNVEIPDIAARLIFAGGAGLIPVLAVASVYDPLISPIEQDFRQGLSKFVATMMRLLLPLTLLVLVIYLFVIPFNFMEPFKNRDVLIIYNVMLFAIMGLLVGATPITQETLPARIQTALRYGILVVAILTVLVSLYALSATVYRTAEGGITINRLTIIGWNTINISILALLIYRQIRYWGETWLDHLKTVYSFGAVGYVAWALFLVFVIPLLFR